MLRRWKKPPSPEVAPSASLTQQHRSFSRVASPTIEALHAARREARIAADTARAQALAERERALIAVYAEAAARAVEALAEIGSIHRELSQVNLNLPIRVEAVGTHLVHVKLPGVDTDGPDYWPRSLRTVFGPGR